MGTLRPQIVLLGDSITEFASQVETGGWGALLANHYSRKADVVFRGFGGYNTRWALLLLDKIFPTASPNPALLATVCFGANDAANPANNSSYMDVPVQEYGKNLHQIVAHLQTQSHVAHIVLITPPPVCERNLLQFQETVRVLITPPAVCERNLLQFQEIFLGDTSGIVIRKNDLTRTYAEECVKVGQETGVRVINTWSMFQEVPNWEEKLLISDGLHLSTEGNATIFRELVKILDDPGLVPTLNANELPWDYPIFQDLEKDAVATLKSWFSPK